MYICMYNVKCLFVHLSIYIGKMDKWTMDKQPHWRYYCLSIFDTVVGLLYPSSAAISR